jgi:hypothetical protein
MKRFYGFFMQLQANWTRATIKGWENENNNLRGHRGATALLLLLGI